MKTLFLAQFWVLLLLPYSFGQEGNPSRYFDERAKGDSYAESSRTEFALSVCKASIQFFCPQIDLSTISYKPGQCKKKQIECGAPITDVEKRFIGKYGIGQTSANRDALPMIKKVFRVLSEIKVNVENNGDGMTPSVTSRINYVAEISGLPANEVKIKLINFFHHFPEHLQTIWIDYWGYFQQETPQRAEWTKVPDLESKYKFSFAFRWCGSKHRFVNEQNTIIGDILYTFLDHPAKDGRWNAVQYHQFCDWMKDETADYGLVKP